MGEEVVVVEAASEAAGVEDLEVVVVEVDVVEGSEVDAEEASEEEVVAAVDVDSEVGDDLTLMVRCDGPIPVFCCISKRLCSLPGAGLLDSEYGHCLSL